MFTWQKSLLSLLEKLICIAADKKFCTLHFLQVNFYPYLEV